MNHLFTIARKFIHHGNIVDIVEFGNGNINDTYLVTLEGETKGHFILQRINKQIFHQPALIMRNIRIISNHMLTSLKQARLASDRRWEVVHLILSNNGQDYWNDSDGSCWRAITFIEGARCFDTLSSIDHAREAGYALGTFHNLLSDLPVDRLADTLVGFHITPLYLEHYEEVLSRCTLDNSKDVKYCMEFINRRRKMANLLEDAKKNGRLLLRTIHGDPKINNIMFDEITGKSIGMVDLDTVKPGLVHYDIGDCLRSGCNQQGEDMDEYENIYFNTDICKAIISGYLEVARFLTDSDFVYIYDSIRLISFELGLRYFTDYLEGNVYFKVKSKEHNLARALVQFKLTESIEKQESAIRKIIDDARPLS